VKEYNGMYLGIVVQNNDPEHRGRVKVYIPHISYNVYKDWYENNENKEFKFPGKNVESDLNNIIEPLKKVLPWAECAAPLIGATGSGRYNAFLETGSISDSSNIALSTPNPAAAELDEAGEYNLNISGLGEAPGKKYETEYYREHDAFTSTLSGANDRPNRVNKYSYTYTPTTYSNEAKGSFSIPNVGSHVWCFLQEGDPNTPVYFAVSHGQEDWAGIYSDNESHQDYPETYENKSKSDDPNYDINTETYRNKFVINQKGGTLEFVNTDNREILKMTHFSGSFKEFTNHANIELATGNEQRLVLQDSFHTTKGFKSEFVGRDLEQLIKGDHYLKIGKLDTKPHEDWALAMAELNDVKQLFETMRAEKKMHEILKRTASGQARDGIFAPCPVCNSSDTVDKRDNLFRILGNMDRYPNGKYRFTLRTSGAGVYSGKEAVRIHNLNEVTNSFRKKSNKTSDILYINNRNAEWSKRGVDESDHSGEHQEVYDTGPGYIFGNKCPVCDGTGVSPSSMSGQWEAEKKKQTSEFGALIQSTAKKLYEIEKHMGVGGSSIEHIAKHKSETIGLHMNDFGSIRIDTEGKIARSSVVVHPGGVINAQKESPILEYVHVDDMPGGDYTLNVCNKWNVQVGAGGISMKSFGPVDVSGTITNIAGEQVNIASDNEINIDGGKRVSIVADILSLRQRDRGQVLVDSNLGVSQNVVIGGGMHVEGELTVNHITAPVEIQETDPVVIFGQLLKRLVFRCNIDGGTHVDAACASDNHNHWSNATVTLVADSNQDKVRMYPHTHHFRNVPLNLKTDNDAVREDAMDNNSPTRRPSKPIESEPYYSKVDKLNLNKTDSTEGIVKKKSKS